MGVYCLRALVRHKGDDPILRSKCSASLVIGLFIVMFVVAIFPQPTTAKFVLASWSFPDQYGQGIDEYHLYENSTGAWLPFDGAYYTDSSSHTIQWNATQGAVEVRVSAWQNMTLTGAIDGDDGKLYHRHYINVACVGLTIFSQQNLTYYGHGGLVGTLRNYDYKVILPFLPQAGSIYVITITYEVFY